jgi:phosphatidylinositol alpha-1,6-mannosyltransferase
MSVLALARVFPPRVGGSGRFMWELYRRMAPGGIRVAAGEFTGSEDFDSDATLAIERLPLDVRNWGLLPLGFPAYIANLRLILRIVRRQRITVLHAGTLLPEGFLAWMVHRCMGLPYLLFVHGEEVPIVAGSRELSWMVRRVLGGASAIIANSENTRCQVLKHWPTVSNKLTVITPGVDVEQFHPAARDPKIRQRLGWAGRHVVLTAGRLQMRKGHDCLIRALPAIRESVPDVLYAIVGDGDHRAALESLADANGVRDCVKFYGAVGDSELVECYQQCDVLALPNREVNGDFEGFGMVLVEAQACGRPVLAGASGGTSETMRPGETGCLVSCDEPGPVALALIDMLSDPAKLDRMGAAGRHWAVEKFDWKVIAGRAAEVFQSISDNAPLDRTRGARRDNESAVIAPSEALRT